MERLKKLKRSRWLNAVLIMLIIGMLSYHFFYTHNPPITQPVIVSPITSTKKLDNGQLSQIKVNTPATNRPEYSGFSSKFVADTINKLLNVKNKEIVSINKVKGFYKDSLQLYKTELNEQKKLTKFYQSKDNKGNIVGTAKSEEDGSMVYRGNISLTSVVKKGIKDKHGNIVTPDSLVFYDPTQRVTIQESLEYVYLLPVEKVKKSKVTFGISVGMGAVVPVNVKDNKVNVKDLGVGAFIGPSVNFRF